MQSRNAGNTNFALNFSLVKETNKSRSDQSHSLPIKWKQFSCSFSFSVSPVCRSILVSLLFASRLTAFAFNSVRIISNASWIMTEDQVWNYSCSRRRSIDSKDFTSSQRNEYSHRAFVFRSEFQAFGCFVRFAQASPFRNQMHWARDTQMNCKHTTQSSLAKRRVKCCR